MTIRESELLKLIDKVIDDWGPDAYDAQSTGEEDIVTIAEALRERIESSARLQSVGESGGVADEDRHWIEKLIHDINDPRNTLLLGALSPVQWKLIVRGLESLLAPAAPSSADDLAMLIRRLVQALKKHEPESSLAAKAMDYLQRHGLQGDVLRAAPSSVPADESSIAAFVHSDPETREKLAADLPDKVIARQKIAELMQHGRAKTLIVAIEEAITSLEMGMAIGALGTLKDALQDDRSFYTAPSPDIARNEVLEEVAKLIKASLFDEASYFAEIIRDLKSPDTS